MNKKPVLDMQGIYREVRTLLGTDTSGHGIDHVERVVRLAREFAKKEGADEQKVELAALLHDVDDYKIFGEDHAARLLHANRILEIFNVPEPLRQDVLGIIRTMGYSKYLEGVRPASIEGRVVSDADMCDAIGATGILRTHAYALTQGNVFFDSSLSPRKEEVTAARYKESHKNHSVQHFFDKLLRIPDLLMTETGRSEGEKRAVRMIHFLHDLFEEEDAKDWLHYLEMYECKNE